jgi:hypothetical protein
MTPQQMDKIREKGLSFNCDNMYSKWHKCGEKKLFSIDREEDEDQELEQPQDLDIEETNPTISCHALVGINTPETLNIQGYIKKKKVAILIDSCSTHNFINYKLENDVNLFVYPTLEFQVMIAYGYSINYLWKCHIMKLNMGEYFLDSPMIFIQMGGVDVVLGDQWLQLLGTMALNFQELFMRFSSYEKEIYLIGIQGKPSKVISSNNMKQLLKTGHNGVVAELRSLDVQTSISATPLDCQLVINNHSKVFGEMCKVLPRAQDHDHVIHLQPGSV